METVTLMATLTLATWLNEELKKRDMSIREFSRASKIGHTTLNNIVNIPEHYPSVDTLVRLARFTRTDVCSLLTMLAPDVSQLDAGTAVLAQRIKGLSETKREFIESYIIGQFLKPEQDEAEV
jgi:transcriptional regulator with XRE-family HTH domain